MLFPIFFKLEHGQHPVVTFGEPVGPSDNPAAEKHVRVLLAYTGTCSIYTRKAF